MQTKHPAKMRRLLNKLLMFFIPIATFSCLTLVRNKHRKWQMRMEAEDAILALSEAMYMSPDVLYDGNIGNVNFEDALKNTGSLSSEQSFDGKSVDKEDSVTRLFVAKDQHEEGSEEPVRSSDGVQMRDSDKIDQVSQLSDSTQQSSKTNSDSLCAIEWSSQWRPATVSEPLVKLSKQRFLLPVLINGPNNQLVGFRKTIFIAIKLNRTVVIPKFFAHRSDRKVNPGHRIDFSQLTRLVRFVTLDEFRSACHNRLDAVFRIRKMTRSSYTRIEEATNMTIIRRSKEDNNHPLMEYPRAMEIKGKFLSFKSSEIHKLYDSEESCAVHPFQFSNLRIREKRPDVPGPNKIDIRSILDENLYAEVVRHTPYPKHVEALSKEFVNDVLKGKNYVSVHWRFNSGDWMNSCDGNYAPPARMKMCKEIRAFRPKHIADGIANKMKAVRTKVDLSSVYIASPPSQEDVMEQVKEYLKKNHNYDVFTNRDVTMHWKSKYKLCDWLWGEENELLSLTEMDVCSRAAVFLRASSSSWSNNVHLTRTTDVVPSEYSNMDEPIYPYVSRAFKEDQKRKSSE